MEQPNDWQPELFQEFQQPPRPPWWARYWRLPHRYLTFRVAYEDLIVATIGGLMVVVLGFCLGVERGKHLVAATTAATESPTPMPAPVAPVPAMPEIHVPAPARAPVVPAPTAQPPGRTKLAYVVQVASYADRAAAEAARTRLVSQGLRASVATKGKYQVVYAEGFATYAQATEAVGRLRKDYRDCFVRKITVDHTG